MFEVKFQILFASKVFVHNTFLAISKWFLDRLPFPLLANHGPDSILCATQSGCLLYNETDKLSTVSIQLDEPPLSINSTFPWAVAGTSGKMFITPAFGLKSVDPKVCNLTPKDVI